MAKEIKVKVRTIDLTEVSKNGLITLLKRRNPDVAKKLSNAVNVAQLNRLLGYSYLLTEDEYQHLVDMGAVTEMSEGSSEGGAVDAQE